MTAPLTVLKINASARKSDSVTRDLAEQVVADLARSNDVRTIDRDVSVGLPVIDETWVAANFTEPAERTPAQRETLALSDRLVGELKSADVLVIGVPIYNFGVPASLKAWVDLVARARETFRYTETGPVGLLEGKKAILIIASGGVEVGSGYDFASGYLRHLLGFIGIKDVEIVAADRLMAAGEEGISRAKAAVSQATKALSLAA